MGKKPVVCLAGLFWVSVTLAGCENTGRPGANSSAYTARPTWPGNATARDTPSQQSSGWSGQPRNGGGNTLAASDAPVTRDTSSAGDPGVRQAADPNTTPGAGAGVPSPSDVRQTAAFPSNNVTPGMSTGESVPPAPSPPAGAPATAGHVSQMIRSGDGLGAVPEAPPPLPASLERRSTDLNTGADPQPARGATAGDGMAVPRSPVPTDLPPPPDIRSRSVQPLSTTGDKLSPVSPTPAASGPSAPPSTPTADSPGYQPPYMSKNPSPPGM